MDAIGLVRDHVESSMIQGSMLQSFSEPLKHKRTVFHTNVSQTSMDFTLNHLQTVSRDVSSYFYVIRSFNWPKPAERLSGEFRSFVVTPAVLHTLKSLKT